MQNSSNPPKCYNRSIAAQSFLAKYNDVASYHQHRVPLKDSSTPPGTPETQSGITAEYHSLTPIPSAHRHFGGKQSPSTTVFHWSTAARNPQTSYQHFQKPVVSRSTIRQPFSAYRPPQFEPMSHTQQQTARIDIPGFPTSGGASLVVTGSFEALQKFNQASKILIPQANEPSTMTAAFEVSLAVLQALEIFPTNQQIGASALSGGAFSFEGHSNIVAPCFIAAGRTTPPIKNVFFLDGALEMLRRGEAYFGDQLFFEIGLLTHDLVHNSHNVDIVYMHPNRKATHTLWLLRRIEAAQNSTSGYEETFLGFTFRSDHPQTKSKPKISSQHFNDGKQIKERFTVQEILSGRSGLTADQCYGGTLLWLAMHVKNTNELTDKINRLRVGNSTAKLSNNNLTKRISAALKAKAWLEDRDDDEVTDEYDMVVHGKVNTRRKQKRSGLSKNMTGRHSWTKLLESECDEDMMEKTTDGDSGVDIESEISDDMETEPGYGLATSRTKRTRSSHPPVSYAEPSLESEDEDEEAEEAWSRKKVKCEKWADDSDDESDAYEDN